MHGGRSSNTVIYSLSELAFVLFTLALAVTVFLAVELQNARAAATALRADNEALRQEVGALEDEVADLTASLERLLGGVVACWRRPDSPLPPIAATVTIKDPYRYVVTATGGASRLVETVPATAARAVEETLRSALAASRRYAAANGCYLRIAVDNRTDSYPLYQQIEEVVDALGMVVVHQ